MKIFLDDFTVYSDMESFDEAQTLLSEMHGI
jgi:hypothetical protein